MQEWSLPVADYGGWGLRRPQDICQFAWFSAQAASASLLQGQVARNLPGFVADAFGLENDAERALQFVRSAPGITTALVGMSRPEHAKANARLLSVPTATVDQFSKLFARGEGA